MMVIKNQGHQAIVISPEDLFQEPDVSLRPAPSDVLQFARERNQRFRSRKRRPDKLSEPLDNLTREEELALFKELRDNPDKSSKDEIKECLVNSQEAWIATLARRRVRGKKKHAELLESTMQAGRRGALEAIERFDTLRGARFNTYATFWINREIVHEIAENDPRLKIPAKLMSHLSGYYSACGNLFDTQFRDPSADDVHKIMKINGSEISLDDVKLLHRRANPFSLDTPMGDNDDSTMATIQEQIREKAPDHRITSLDEARRLHGILARIPPGDRLVMKLSKGIGTTNGRRYGFEEISRGLGWSGNTYPKQILSRAMRYADINKDAPPQDPDNREVYVFEKLLLPLSQAGFGDRAAYKKEGLKVAGRGEDGPLFLRLVETPMEKLSKEVSRLRIRYGAEKK